MSYVMNIRTWSLVASVALAVGCDAIEIRLFELELAPVDAGAQVVVPLAVDATVRDVSRAAVDVESPTDAGGNCPRGSEGQCVQCANDRHCEGTTPACDTQSNLCVECTLDTFCEGQRPYCDVAVAVTTFTSFTCNECVSDEQCQGSEECQREADEPEEGLHCEN